MNDIFGKTDILIYAKEKYGTDPEYLWTRYPNYAVLRHKMSKKWYAVIMNVSKDKVGICGEGKIDILNIKTGPIMKNSLLGKKGFVPAYHMNKANWITVILDGSVLDKEICDLLDLSFDITEQKKDKIKI